MSARSARFFGRPTRGGVLTILNAVLWLLVAYGAMNGVAPLVPLFFILSPPLAWCFVLPVLGNRSPGAGQALVMACVMIGANSFLWGYGLSWVWSAAFGRRKGVRRRGFDVVVNQPLATPPAL